ncbi:hypothetical protein [Clostridium sp. AWRP]|uniref:hypothetical protein n=1 Tax=Clostridium sp. AWRP TaxID=2212991 RepID=UPI000FDC87DA|nr:hypothetical protein [Clostridium sp. AWRP]AZV56082.1 hypothetical protein DMR38_05420 [Clostridium sp. AWRP]
MDKESLLSFNFSNGINEYKDETLLDASEASKAQNIDIDSGVLSTIKEPSTVLKRSNIVRLAKFFKNGSTTLMPLETNSDYLNYQVGDTEVMLIGDGITSVKVYDGSSYRNLENRRIENITTLNIPPLKPQTIVRIGGGSKENSIKVQCFPTVDNVNSIYIRRSIDMRGYDCGQPVPYDAIPYASESDILETYVGEVITLFEKGYPSVDTYDPTTGHTITTKMTSGPKVIVMFIQFPVTEDMITKSVTAPQTFTESPPKGSMIELNHERVWLAGDVDFPNRVYFSKDLDIDDWTIPIDEGEANQHGGLIDVPTWDGGIIIGLKVLFGDLFVFKNRNIFRIFGTYPGNYELEQVCSTTGAISDRSIVSGPSAVYFASKEGIYAFNGTSANLVSQKIRDTWKNINQDYIKNAVGIFYDNKYYLAVPEGNSTTNNLLIKYNTEDGNFTFIRGLEINDFIEFNGNMYFSNDSGVYNMFQSEDLNTNGYEANWTTGKLNFGASNAVKRTEKMYFLGSGNGKIQISIENEKGKKKTVKLPLPSTEKMFKKRIRNRGRTLKFSFSSVEGSKFKLKDMQITYETEYD